MPLHSNEKIIEEFLKELEKRGLSERSIKKYRITLRKFGFVDYAKLTKKDCEKIFFSIKNSKLSDETKEDYWIRFKIFVKWLKPKIVLNDFKLLTKKKRKLPEEILTVEEVRKMIQFADSVRDRAMLSLLYDSGCRPGELLNLKLGDIFFDDDGLIIKFNGKTGERRIRIITTCDSHKLLKEYLQILKISPDAPIFNISLERLCKIVKEIAKKAGINKKIYPYIFRHSRATYLAKHLNEQEMKVYFGWTMDSKMVSTYVHLSGKDLDEKVFELNQKDFLFIPSQSFKEFLYQLYLKWKEKNSQIELTKLL